MSDVTPEARIAETLAPIVGVAAANECAAVLANHPNLAIVELPADPGDGDYLRWEHWSNETEEAFHEATLVELRRIHAVSVSEARAAGSDT